MLRQFPSTAPASSIPPCSYNGYVHHKNTTINAVEEGTFYLQLLSKITLRGSIALLLAEIPQKYVHWSRNKINHSLRATGVTQLFQAKVPKKIIQQWTCHYSLVSLRAYRTTEEQHQAVSSLLAAGPQLPTTSYTSQYCQSKKVVNVRQPLQIRSSFIITFQGLTGCIINFCQQSPSQPPYDPFPSVILNCRVSLPISKTLQNTATALCASIGIIFSSWYLHRTHTNRAQARYKQSTSFTSSTSSVR